MKTLKNTILKVFGGIGLWIVLVLFNTRSGEPGLNFIKMILDVIMVVMLVGNSLRERRVALGITIASVISTFMNLHPLIEVLLLIAYVFVGIRLLFFLAKNYGTDTIVGDTVNEAAFSETVPMYWKERNWLNPLFEKYTYSAEEGISITKGVLKSTYINIPTTHIRMRIDQTFFQRVIGLCNVSFINIYTGELFGNEILHNIKIKSARVLFYML